MRRIRTAAFLAFVATLPLSPAQATHDEACHGSSLATVGWAGTGPYGPAPSPYGVNPAQCTFTIHKCQVSSCYVYFRASAYGAAPAPFGLQIIVAGLRFSCAPAFGAGYSPPGTTVACASQEILVEFRMNAAYTPAEVYCGTTGVVNVLVNIDCRLDGMYWTDGRY